MVFTIKFYNRIENRHVDSLSCTTCSLENQNIFPGIYMTHTLNCCCRLSLSQSEVFFELFSWSDFYTLTLFFLRANLSSRKYGWDSRSFKCFLATCKRTDIIRWLKMARTNSRVLSHLKIYPDISSYCNNPLSEHTFVVWELMKRTFHAVFLIHLPGTEWSCRRPSMPHFHFALPRSSRATAILELGVFSVLYYVIKVTLHYLMLHRFEIHSALELSRTPALLGCCLACSLTSLRGCSLAIIRFTIVIIILPVCNASQLTY